VKLELMFAGYVERPRGEWRLLEEQRWEFDLSGVVHCPGLLAEVADADSVGQWEGLAEHPALVAKLEQIFGAEYPNFDHAAASSPISYILDRPPRLLEPGDGPAAPLPDCVDPVERLRLRYDDYRARPDVSAALGLRVLVALEATSDIVVVPCSHKTDPTFPAPATLREIEELYGTVLRPTLAAGDVLLLAAPTVVARQEQEQSSTGSPLSRVLELLLVNPALCAPGMGYVSR
jgi:hypothetical protein